MFESEKELLFILNEHDELIINCISGHISFDDFLYKYNDFYMTYALDGHESDSDEQKLFEILKSRIAPHREVWEKITGGGLCSDEDANKDLYIQAKRFGSDEGLKRLIEIGDKYFSNSTL